MGVMITNDVVEHTSSKEELEKESLKRMSHCRDKERNGERSKYRFDREHRSSSDKKERESRRKERERSRDRYKNGHEKKDKEKERFTRHKEGRDRESDRLVDREKEEKERGRAKERERERAKEDRKRQHERKRQRRDDDHIERGDREQSTKRSRYRDEAEVINLEEKTKEELDIVDKREDTWEEMERESAKEREEDRGKDRERERERKRRRRDDDHKERNREQSSKRSRYGDEAEVISLEEKTKEELELVDKGEDTWEDNAAEEERKLDEEIEKRRRRVQEWQELRSIKEESERAATNVEESKSGKAWTLEGESDDEEATFEGVNGDSMHVTSAAEKGVEGSMDDEDIDPLDAFMNSMVLPEIATSENMDTGLKEKNGRDNEEQIKKEVNKSLGRIIASEDSDSEYEHIENEADEDEDDAEFLKRVKKTKAEKLAIVDHSKINYDSFKKTFYVEAKDIATMTPDKVSAYREQLELKIHGEYVPKPVKTWHQTGLGTKILDKIKKMNYEKPMPVQAQAMPIIMSGRDCISIAKTGSGKTLAFVLPMLRHISAQPPVTSGDGPIGLVMAPTRELVQQIHSDIKRFANALGFRCVPIYGGSGVAQQINELKRGTEIVVCTPGRMIDILCTSAGKITNLRRVTYLVMDEADRMFDMGFEPQITKIVQNTRPDRQTVLFSATFPRQVEKLAHKVLNNHSVQIQVGGRSVVNKDIAQLVEVRPERDKFLRLLEILGDWHEKGKILIFVNSHEKCDTLFKDLLKHGYPCLSLHGAKDQTDRECAIADFKYNVCNLLIATSIAARGLDVKELELVINFDAPDHYEDYVHRVGRTGRAGRKGYAITFMSEEDAKYAPILVKALELSDQQGVPDDLKALADGFLANVSQGLEQAHSTRRGRGYKFNEEEDEAMKAAKKAQAREYGFEEDQSDSEDEDIDARKADGENDISQQDVLARAAALAAAIKTSGPNEGAARAAALAAAMNLKHTFAKIQADHAMPERYEAELEINDFPQHVRYKVTRKEMLVPISEWTGASITTRGQFFPPGKLPGSGERKLLLFIEGPTDQSVKRAKAELKHALESMTMQASYLPGSAVQPGKYSVT